MKRVRLIHWNAVEAQDSVKRLRAAGYEVSYEPFTRTTLRTLRENPPAAVVIDLTRLPSQGRDVGLAVRHYKTTRHLPLVMVGGDPEKLERIKGFLPDAVYTTWPRIRVSLKRAIARSPIKPVAPRSLMEGYSGTPLPKKLGIKPEFVVALVNAPEDFEKTLGGLPQGVSLRRQARGRRDLTILFIRTRKELQDRIDRMVAHAEKGGLWISWPKKTSGIATDLTQADVRRVGLAAGLVDYKVCAIDDTWSGLRFTFRGGKAK